MVNILARFSSLFAVVLLATSWAIVLSEEDGYTDVTMEYTSTQIPTITPTIDPDKPHGEDILTDNGMKAVYHMTTWFLESIVQPRNLKYLEDEGVDFSDPGSIFDDIENDWEMWAIYGVGYLVCASLGVVLLIVIPVVGCMVACCRCCGNCGGKPSPREGKSAKCHKSCCGVFLFIFSTVIILGGVVMIFATIRIDEQLSSKDDNMFYSLAESIEQVDEYMKYTLHEANQASVGNFRDTKDEIFLDLDTAVGDAVQDLDDQTQASHNIDVFLKFDEQLENLEDLLVVAQNYTNELNNGMGYVDTELSTINGSLAAKLNGCNDDACTNLNALLPQLKTDANFSTFNFEEAFINIRNFITTSNLHDNMENALKEITDVITEVNNTVDQSIQEAKKEADVAEATIDDFMTKLKDEVDKIDFSKASQTLKEIYDDDIPEWVWDIVFWSLLGIAIFVLLIAFCFLMGIVHGVICERPAPYGNYCCTKKMGADWLLAGVGIAFMLYWIFMLIVISMFIVGGVTHTEVCRHLVYFNESPVADILTKMVNNSFAENNDVSINLTEIYNDCGNNQALYTTLKLDTINGLNITEIMDADIFEQAVSAIKSVQIDINNVTFMSLNLTQDLKAFETDLDTFRSELEGYLTEINKGITEVPLDTVLMYMNNITQQNISIEITQMTDLNHGYVKLLEENKGNLQETLNDMQIILNATNITGWIYSLEYSENMFNTKGESIIGEHVNGTADNILKQIMALTTLVDKEIRHDVGKCYPVYDSVVSIVDKTCIEMLYPLNGYWFALAWCILFFIPSIIIAFKLATLYRKTLQHNEDEQDDYHHTYMSGHEDGYFEPPIELPLTRNSKHAEVAHARAMSPIDNPVYQSDDHYRIPRPAVKVMSNDNPPPYSAINKAKPSTVL